MFYFKIGFRNVKKNLRRSLLTIISIVIGMVSILLTRGFFNWHLDNQRELVIRNGIGHFQLYKKGFLEYGTENPNDYYITDVRPIFDELRQNEGIELVTARVALSGILSSGERTTVVAGEAGIPEDEFKLNTYSGIVMGDRLKDETLSGVVIGSGVAKRLSAAIGDTLTLIVYMNDGVINAVDLELTGIKSSGVPELDNSIIATHLATAQELLNIDSSVRKIIVLLKNTKDAPKMVSKIDEICKKYELEYKEWKDLADYYNSLQLMFDAVFYVIILIIMFIVTFTISNTVNINLNERIREIGTIRAMGTKRSDIVKIVIIENGLLGIFGGIGGLIIGYLMIGFNELIGGVPVQLTISGQSIWVNLFFRPDLVTILMSMAFFVLTAVVAAVFPARKASKIAVTEALRWV